MEKDKKVLIVTDDYKSRNLPLVFQKIKNECHAAMICSLTNADNYLNTH